MTPKRPRRQVENDDYAAFIPRILHAYSRRVGDGDIEALVLMLDLAEVIDTAMCLIAAELDRCTSGSRAGSGVPIPIHKLSPRKGDRTLPI